MKFGTPQVVAAPYDDAVDKSDKRCPRVAFKSRWLDTIIACQDFWWAGSWQSAKIFAELLEALREADAAEVIDAIAERLLRSFISLPVIGAPKFLNTLPSNPHFSQFATCYRAKFFFSYSMCLAASILPDKQASTNRLTRRYTAFGPAPRILFQALTGALPHDPTKGYVAFARKLRDILHSDFGVDLELYSVQYAPCLFHRFCPILANAMSSGDHDVFLPRTSEAREGALAFAAKEEHELQALLVYLRGHDAAWALLRDCTVHQRACVFRSLDLAAVVDPKYKLKSLLKFVGDVLKKPTCDCDLFWLRTDSVVCQYQYRHRYHSTSMEVPL